MIRNSANIDEGATLFTVNARAWLEDGTLSEFEPIGEIIQGDSPWTESLWGDERLFFGHGPIVYDIRDQRLNIADEAIPTFNRVQRAEIDEFDSEKYGEWGDFVPQEADESDVIEGMVSNGCPFSFVIDQINGLF